MSDFETVYFEPGQRVKCVQNTGVCSPLENGEIYEVRVYASPFVFLMGYVGGFNDYLFELVKDGVSPARYAHSYHDAGSQAMSEIVRVLA